MGEAFICGKILLDAECKILFICEICYKELKQLPELLEHLFHEHIKGLPMDKLRELCRNQAKQEDYFDTEEEDDVDTEMMIHDMLDDPVNEEHREVVCAEIVGSTKNIEIEPIENQLQKQQVETATEVEALNTEIIKSIKDQCEELQTGSIAIEEDKSEEIKPSEDQCKEKAISMATFEAGEQLQKEQFEFCDIKKKIPKIRKEKNPITKDRSEPAKPQHTRGKECNICFKKFSKLHQLQEHKKEHGDRPYICCHCGVGFRDRTNMQVHYLRHMGIKPYSCTMCEKTFTTTTEAKIHMRSHTGEQPYKCTECDKAFTTASKLASHRRWHRNERPYLCNVCGKSFVDSQPCREHAMRHSTERPHKCTECDASFTVRKGLVQHLKLHSDVKNYSCKYCGKEFAQYAGLYSHMKSHKGELNISEQ